MFKKKKKKWKYNKLSKKEQKEIIANTCEESLILFIVFSILALFFNEEMLHLFKSISMMNTSNILTIIVLLIPPFLLIAILETLSKVLWKRKR